MRTTFNISFYCRESKKNREGLSPLEMSININGERLFINLPSRFKPSEFNKKRKPSYIQETIDNYRIKVNDVVNDLLRNNLPITSTTLREYFRTGGVKPYTVEDLWKEYLSLLSIRVGVSMKETVYRKYELSRDLCYEIIGKDRQLSTITNGDMIRFYDTLKRRFMASTAAGYFTKTKTVFTYAIDNGKMSINPFNGIKIDKIHTTISYLSENEIEALKTVELDNDRLNKARDLLLFQYSIGTAYIDMINFNPSKIVYNEETNTYLYTAKRKKTGIQFTTVILPIGIEILHKYNNQLPYISNQKLNQYAKEIQRAADIRTTITTHICRKTYAQTMLSHGVRMETVAKLLGHSTIQTTQKLYCEVNKDIIATEVANAFAF